MAIRSILLSKSFLHRVCVCVCSSIPHVAHVPALVHTNLCIVFLAAHFQSSKMRHSDYVHTYHVCQ